MEWISRVVADLMMMSLWCIWLYNWFTKQLSKLLRAGYQWSDDCCGFASWLWFHNTDVLCLHSSRSRLICGHCCSTGTRLTSSSTTPTCTSWNCRMTGGLAIGGRSVFGSCYVRGWTSSLTKNNLMTQSNNETNKQLQWCTVFVYVSLMWVWLKSLVSGQNY